MSKQKSGKKGGKRGGGRKKLTDPFLKKIWYDVQAPNAFSNRHLGLTVCPKPSGQRKSINDLRGRVFETSLGDLNNDEDQAFRIMQFVIEDANMRSSGVGLCLTNYHGMRLTSDKVKGLVRKKHTKIQCITDVRLMDGYTVRLFCVAYTKKRPNQRKRPVYCKTGQVRLIRAKMAEIIKRECDGCTLPQLFEKFKPEIIGKEIEREAFRIFPIQNVYIFKCKVIKKPKIDIDKLKTLHSQRVVAQATKGGSNQYDAGDFEGEDVGAPIEGGMLEETLPETTGEEVADWNAAEESNDGAWA
mmetsp:Transcript_18042/g.20085  ORF Transcript_18042/g.20085 Transcript_18042/m.20085 type:complete len:300 (+) Transcript_18042:44-943(+)